MGAIAVAPHLFAARCGRAAGHSEVISPSGGLRELLRFVANPKVAPFISREANSIFRDKKSGHIADVGIHPASKRVRIQDMTSDTISDGWNDREGENSAITVGRMHAESRDSETAPDGRGGSAGKIGASGSAPPEEQEPRSRDGQENDDDVSTIGASGVGEKEVGGNKLEEQTATLVPSNLRP